MSTQLTTAEIENFARLLQNYDPGKIALTTLIDNNGQIEQSFEQLWTEKYGKQDFGSKSIWQSTLTVLRQELCGDEGIKNQVKEYSKNPTSAPLLTGLIVAVLGAAGLPIDPAIATVIVLYILKVGINIFCEYIKPDVGV
jgi:hypothetical protein